MFAYSQFLCPPVLLLFSVLFCSVLFCFFFFFFFSNVYPPLKVVFSDSSSDAPPQLRVPSLLLAVVKVALKALHEATRLTTFQSPAVKTAL